MYANGNCVFFRVEHEWVRWREDKRILDLTSINPFHIHQKLYTCAFALGLNSIESKLKANMEKVLPANYSIVASCELSSNSDCQPTQRIPVVPRNHMGRESCYHINSICRPRKICERKFVLIRTACFHINFYLNICVAVIIALSNYAIV